MKQSNIGRVAAVSMFLGLLILLQPSISAPYAQAQTPKRVLLLFHYGRESPGQVVFEQGFESAIKSAPPGSLELYRETLESYRFPDPSHEQSMRRYLKEKYADRKMDAIVAHSDTALEFLLRYREELFAGVPLVYAISKLPAPGTEPPLRTGVWAGPNSKDTLAVALQLHPSTQQVFVIIGTSNDNRMVEVETRQQLKEFESRVRLNYLVDRPLEEVINTVKALPENSIVLCQRQTRDIRTLLSSAELIELGGERCVLVASSDITERKRLEQQLQRSEREFSTLVENSPDVISRLDRNLRYTYVSPVLESVSALGPESFLGKTPGEIDLPGYDWRSFESVCRAALKTRQTAAREFQYHDRHYRTRVIPEFGPDGRVESLMAISEDVTERVRAEQELRKLTARLFSLQDEERRRIARELHDGAAQNIFGITVSLANLQRQKGNSEGRFNAHN